MSINMSVLHCFTVSVYCYYYITVAVQISDLGTSLRFASGGSTRNLRRRRSSGAQLAGGIIHGVGQATSFLNL